MIFFEEFFKQIYQSLLCAPLRSPILYACIHFQLHKAPPTYGQLHVLPYSNHFLIVFHILPSFPSNGGLMIYTLKRFFKEQMRRRFIVSCHIQSMKDLSSDLQVLLAASTWHGMHDHMEEQQHLEIYQTPTPHQLVMANELDHSRIKNNYVQV